MLFSGLAVTKGWSPAFICDYVVFGLGFAGMIALQYLWFLSAVDVVGVVTSPGFMLVPIGLIVTVGFVVRGRIGDRPAESGLMSGLLTQN
jgi:hypothetical protein